MNLRCEVARVSPKLIAIYFFLVLCPTMAAAKDVSGMYSPAILEHWKGILEPWVNKIFKEEIEPNLSPKATRVRGNTKIEVSTTSRSNDPFDYYSQGRSLKVPVLNVKFLYDLVMAHLWLEAHGFEDQSFLYVCALKYQDAGAFPQGRYLAPFDALGVSHNGFMEVTNANDNNDIARNFQQLFNGALLFLVAHEFGHVLQSKEQHTSIEREAEADIFAFEILERSQFNPGGVMLLFMYSSVWVRNAADFNTTGEYQHWLETADHPLTGLRLEMVGTRLARDPHHFFPVAPDSDPRIGLIKLIGSRLIDIGKDLDNLTSRRKLRDVAMDIKIPTLALHKKTSVPSKGTPEAYAPNVDSPEVSPVPNAIPQEARATDVRTIYDAVIAGDLKKVTELLANDPTLIRSEDKQGLTPLMWAAEKGNDKMVELLLSKGSSVNERSKDGFTPLHAAAAARQTAMLKLLVSKGSNVNAKNEDGLSPLFLAAADNYEEGVEFLLSRGAEINATNTTGMTPLQLAAERGHIRIVVLLVAKGANVNAADGTGFTPLLDAVKAGHQDAVELLLSKGANINSKDVGGFTALHVAAFNGRKKIAQILLSKGANLNAKDENGDTPCEIAIKQEETETAAVLCRHR